VECIRLGALDYLVKPFRIEELKRWCRRPGTTSPRKTSESHLNRKPPAAWAWFYSGPESCHAAVFDKIKRAAPSDSTVLLTGESGTGKG